MALHLYRRHRVSCPHRAQAYRRCQCPIYVKGTLGGTYVRMSLDQTNWDAAGRVVATWTEAGKVGQTFDITARTIEETVIDYLADAGSRGLNAETVRKRKVILERLQLWAGKNNYPMLVDLTLERLTSFRSTWQDALVTRSNNQGIISSFLEWCVRRKLLDENPAKGLAGIRVPPNPTLPYTPEQMTAILAACDRYAYGFPRARMKAFVLLMRWTGLRISDVVQLEWSRVQDGVVFLYTQKTGTPVKVPVPPEVLLAVNQLPRTTRYVFWSGEGAWKSAASNWHRALSKVFERAKIVNGHSHRFRDTFAVELLLRGVDLADVSILLGHSSIKTTEASYSPWVSARQTRLAAAVRGTWLVA